MPYAMFDRSKLTILPLSERESDVNLQTMLSLSDPLQPFDNPHLETIADRIRAARRAGAAVIFMMGAHVIRSGVNRYLIELMKRGYVTHFAVNGAGPIHDYELALIGRTTESVARYIRVGQFGLWRETGTINDAIVEGMRDGLGMGEAIGRAIEAGAYPHRDVSLLAAGYRCQVPVTVHVGVGNDIIHEHPNCDGAAIGETSYRDFLIFAETIRNLENGVFLNIGSAVTGPEVYLKALAMARNVAHQEEKSIAHFTTGVFDLLPLEGEDYQREAPKTDPRYYYRPWKTILARTVADGGQSYYVRGEHRQTIPQLARLIFDDSEKGKA